MSSVVKGIGKIFGFGDDKPSTSIINVPGPTATERELMNLQKQYYKSMLTTTPEEAAMNAKAQEYLETMMADEVLSPDEEAEFEREYELSKQALLGQFGIESERYGASQMAELASRGMLETTVGERQIATTQQQFAGELMGNIAEMGQAKELAKSDMEAAKKQMAMQGYQLTKGLMQSNLQAGLTSATNLQNYMASRTAMGANTALQNALINQARNKAQYQQRMSMWGGMTGLGSGMMFGG